MRMARWFLPFNIAAFVYAAYVASLSWAPPGEEELTAGAGDLFIRMTYLFPLLELVALVNFAWVVILVLKRKQWDRVKQEVVPLLIVSTGWMLAAIYDHSRQYAP